MKRSKREIMDENKENKMAMGDVEGVWGENRHWNKRRMTLTPLLYENTFYNQPRVLEESANSTNIVGANKGKPDIALTSAEDLPTSTEDKKHNSNDYDVVNGISKTNTTEEFKQISKPCLHRGMSDSRLYREKYRCNENSERTPFRTEFSIPSEFLFCRKVGEKDNFVSLYRKISSVGTLRRSQSSPSIQNRLPTKSSVDTDESLKPRTCRKLLYKKDELRTTNSTKSSNSKSRSSCNTRSNCEKLCSRKNLEVDRKNNRRKSHGTSANEPQSIVGNDVHNNVERSSIVGINKTNNEERNNSKSAKPRNLGNKRSQSCHIVPKRSNLFNINKYLKDGHTHRSKSFATIREFAKPGIHDTNDRTDSLLHVGLNGYGESRLVIPINQKHRLNTELNPLKTTRNFDVNVTDSHGNTCLHHASSKGDISTIKHLLEQGGDVWLMNDDQRLPVDLATDFHTASLLSSATLFYSEKSERRNERNIIRTSKLNIEV